MSTTKPVLRALAVWVLTVFVAMVLLGYFLGPGIGLIIGVVLASFLASKVGVQAVRSEESNGLQGPPPIAHTPEGEPIYQVVGYTPDGKPVTSDRAVGIQPTASRTNALAIVALIVSLVLAPLAIPLGYMSLAQIERTGEQGRGLAIAGLVIGYIGLAALIIFCIVAVLSAN